MLAILRDQGLKKYVEKTAELLKLRKLEELMTEETEAIWKEGDTKAHTRIELSIRDPKMVHLSSAVMAHDIWNQLSLVKESWGHLGVLVMCQALYQATAKEGFDMVEHISKLRGLLNELHAIENLVTDEDFIMILITSLLEFWDNYTVLSRHISTYCTNPRLGLSSVLASTAIGVQLSTAHSMQHSGNSYYYYYLPCL